MLPGEKGGVTVFELRLRESEFNAVLGSAFKPRPRESWSRAEFRGAFTVSLVRIMFDGLLRGGDASRARWVACRGLEMVREV